MQRGINLQEDTMDRIIVMQKIVDKKMTQEEGSLEVGVSERQVRRLLKRFRAEGYTGIIPRQKSGRRKLEEGFRAGVMSLMRGPYRGFGPTFGAEKLEERDGLKVSRETLRRWMIEEGLWEGKKQKKVRIYQGRKRRPRFGELVQLDGSYHDWFEGRADECCLIVLIDDATSKIITMRFEERETTFGYMRCVEDHIRRYGRALAYYSDRHSIFKTTREQCVDGLLKDTEFHRALKDLNIELICARSPQAKGRVERANGVLQDRLIKEMRLRGISSMEEANAYILEFIEAHNKKFGVPPENLEDAHRPNLRSLEELELIFSKQGIRKVTKNLEFSFEGKRYQILNEGHGYRIQQGHVQIYETFRGVMKVLYGEKELMIKEFKDLGEPLVAESKDVSSLLDKLVKSTQNPPFPTGSTGQGQLSYSGLLPQAHGLMENTNF